MLSATQTRPPLRWPAYVWTYIAPENHQLFTDKSTLNINSDACNHLIFSKLSNPASATFEGKQSVKRLVAFFFGARSGSTILLPECEAS